MYPAIYLRGNRTELYCGQTITTLGFNKYSLSFPPPQRLQYDNRKDYPFFSDNWCIEFSSRSLPFMRRVMSNCNKIFLL